MLAHMRFTYDGNRYQLLEEAGLPYLATERFGLDTLLGHDTRRIDRHIIYVNHKDVKKWVRHIEKHGARPANILPTLILIPTDSLDDLRGNNDNVINLEMLAIDLKLKAPRYRNTRLGEIEEKLPQLYAFIIQHSSPLSLNRA